MVSPTTLFPWRTSSAATVELSTPPDIATAIGAPWLGTSSGMDRNRNAAQVCHRGFQSGGEPIHLGGVLARPSEKRMLARARSASRPMAVRTCDGAMAPLEQAAPVETAKPRRSSAITSASPSTPSN